MADGFPPVALGEQRVLPVVIKHAERGVLRSQGGGNVLPSVEEWRTVAWR